MTWLVWKNRLKKVKLNYFIYIELLLKGVKIKTCNKIYNVIIINVPIIPDTPKLTSFLDQIEIYGISKINWTKTCDKSLLNLFITYSPIY